MAVSDWIKRARTKAGLTQEQLADAIGRKKLSISRWENGERIPNADDLLKISTVTGVSVETPQLQHTEPEVILNATAHSTTEMDVTGSVKRQFNEAPLVVGEEPVWIDIVEPAACAGPGNGYHEVTWKPIGRLPFSPVDLMGYAWHSGKMRVIRIEGSSMEPRYREGDRVLFSDDGVVSGDIVIVMWDSRLYIRGYIVTPDKVVHLMAFNKENPEIVVEPGDPRLQILGKVLAKVGIEPDKGFW